MVKRFISRGKNLLYSPQESIISAASVIMITIVFSKILGFIRQRTLFHFFSPSETDLFLAAFEIPELIFEVFVYGVLSAAFIPVFSKYLSKKEYKQAWRMASASLSLLLIVFAVLAALFLVFANPIYTLITGGFVKNQIGVEGGFSQEQISQIVLLSRILLFAQLFFVISYFLTGVLESFQRFIIPALAPLIYNLGIIFGTVFLSPELGLMGPTVGAMIGAFGHFLIQIPVAIHLGYRPKILWDLGNDGVKSLIRLASPRVLELSFFQVRRLVWLFLASLTAGGITYLKSADLLQGLPIGLFGLSIAKASLPTLSRQAAVDDFKSFKNTFVRTLNQILFLVIPASIFLAVLRIPAVRIIFGAQRFNWLATVQTGYVLTAFSIGIFAYATSLLVSRAFYALHDTKTPVVTSVISVAINTILGMVLVLGLGYDTWAIAFSYSIGGVVQFVFLFSLLQRRIGLESTRVIKPFIKIVLSASVSGIVMFVLLKVLDRSVWVKELSFLGSLGAVLPTNFEGLVVDTRYTTNLVLLTLFIAFVGVVIYLGLAKMLGIKEMDSLFDVGKRIIASNRRKPSLSSVGKQTEESISSPPSNGQS